MVAKTVLAVTHTDVRGETFGLYFHWLHTQNHVGHGYRVRRRLRRKLSTWESLILWGVGDCDITDLHIIHWLSSYDVKCNVGNSEIGGNAQEH